MKKAKLMLLGLCIISVAGAGAAGIAVKKLMPNIYYVSAEPTDHATISILSAYTTDTTLPLLYYTTVFYASATVCTYFTESE